MKCSTHDSYNLATYMGLNEHDKGCCYCSNLSMLLGSVMDQSVIATSLHSNRSFLTTLLSNQHSRSFPSYSNLEEPLKLS